MEWKSLKFVESASDKLHTQVLGVGMKNLVLAFLKDEDGQTSTEYILLVAVVALIVFKFKGTATTKLESITNGVFTGAEGWVEQINQEAQ